MPRAANRPVGVGVVGVGTISETYLTNLTGRFADAVRVVGCADLRPERAEEARRIYSLPKAYGSVDELLSDPDVEVVLNLTIPASHAEVSRAAVRSGKHVYSEKPLAVEIRDAGSLLDEADAAGVLVGCAPDTFLGSGLQTCRTLCDEGAIGDPVAVTAFMMNRGPESWHPAPEFYFRKGGGPMFDMGPYYLTALVTLLGPVARVSGFVRKTFDERIIGSGPLKGNVIAVDVPTHVAGTLEFRSGVVGTVIMSFDVWAASVPRIELYGTSGTLNVPDPNTFGGPVRVRGAAGSQWAEVPLRGGYPESSRGLGLADMARAIVGGRPHRASGHIARHVLEVMHGFHIASAEGRAYSVESSCERPSVLTAL